jgi:hypothetical protein
MGFFDEESFKVYCGIGKTDVNLSYTLDQMDEIGTLFENDCPFYDPKNAPLCCTANHYYALHHEEKGVFRELFDWLFGKWRPNLRTLCIQENRKSKSRKLV